MYSMSRNTELAAIHESLRSLHEKIDKNTERQNNFVTHKESWLKTGALALFISVVHGVMDWKEAILKFFHIG